MYKHNGQPLKFNPDGSFTIGDGEAAITHPADNLTNSDLLAELGITVEYAPATADDRYYWNGDENTPKDIDGLRKTALEQIKLQRQVALDSFSKSAGISAAYDENIKAAHATKAGAGGTTIMRDNSTAEAYLAKMASGMGITADQFADYVIAENAASAAKASEIEVEYVRLAYSFIPQCTFEEVKTVNSEYVAFCVARIT